MLRRIKNKFIAIYMLNVSDIVFTILLLQTGAFMEGNFFMRGIVENRVTSLMIKLGIPLVLLYVIYKRLKSATVKQLAIGNKLVNGCLVFYALVNSSHLIWIILYNAYFI